MQCLFVWSWREYYFIFAEVASSSWWGLTSPYCGFCTNGSFLVAGARWGGTQNHGLHKIWEGSRGLRPKHQALLVWLRCRFGTHNSYNSSLLQLISLASFCIKLFRNFFFWKTKFAFLFVSDYAGLSHSWTSFITAARRS